MSPRIIPLSNACAPLSSYFRLLGSANLSGSRSDVMVRPIVLLSAAASQAISTVARNENCVYQMPHGTTSARQASCRQFRSRLGFRVRTNFIDAQISKWDSPPAREFVLLVFLSGAHVRSNNVALYESLSVT